MKRDKTLVPFDPIPSNSKKQKINVSTIDQSRLSLNSLVVRYDSFVLRHVFTYCSPGDIISLSLVGKEWSELFFTREKIISLFREWIEKRWNKFCENGKVAMFWDFEWIVSEKSCLVDEYLPRLLKALDAEVEGISRMEEVDDDDEFQDQNDEEEQDEEDEEEEEDEEDEEDEDEQDDEGGEDVPIEMDLGEQRNEEKHAKEKISMICDEISSSLTLIEIDHVKLCKIVLDPNQFILISKKYGNIILFRKEKKEISCLFYGSLMYPNWKYCNYRSSFWIPITRRQKGIFVSQIQQIVSYLGLDEKDYTIGCHFLTIIGMDSKISKSNYECYPWGEGEAFGKIESFPWNFESVMYNPSDLSYVCGSMITNDFGDIIDDRFFTDIDLFSAFVLSIRRLDVQFLKSNASRVDQSLLKNRKLLHALKNEYLFEMLDQSLRHDITFIQEALKVNASIVKYLFGKEYHSIITIDREIIISCLKNGLKLSRLPSDIEIDKEIAMASIEGGTTIKDLPVAFRNDTDIVIQGLKRDPFMSLQFAKTLITDKDSALELVKYGSYPLRWIDNDLIAKHPEIEEQAIKNHFLAINYAKKTPELLKLANDSLLKLLKTPGKKINIQIDFGNGKKENRIVEISKKSLQTVFMVERRCSFGTVEKYQADFVSVFGPVIEEKGYHAKFSICFEKPLDETKQTKFINTLIEEHLESLAAYGKNVELFTETVESFLN